MAAFIKKITVAAKNRTTYRVGLLQAKAFRILKGTTNKALVKYELTTVHWALLGLLYDSQKGIRGSNVAEELGVEAPFVTALFNELKRQGLAQMDPDPNDNRAKLLCLTTKGKKFVEQIETYLRTEMRSLVKDVSTNDLLSYLVVLEKIIENSKNSKENFSEEQ